MFLKFLLWECWGCRHILMDPSLHACILGTWMQIFMLLQLYLLNEPSPKPLLLLWSKYSPPRNQEFMLDFLLRPLQLDLEFHCLIFKCLSHPCVLEINLLWLWPIIFSDTLLELILRIFHNLYSWRKPTLYFLLLWCLFGYQKHVYITGSWRVSPSIFFLENLCAMVLFPSLIFCEISWWI